MLIIKVCTILSNIRQILFNYIEFSTISTLMEALEKTLGLGDDIKFKEEDADKDMEFQFKAKVRWDHVLE